MASTLDVGYEQLLNTDPALPLMLSQQGLSSFCHAFGKAYVGPGTQSNQHAEPARAEKCHTCDILPHGRGEGVRGVAAYC